MAHRQGCGALFHARGAGALKKDDIFEFFRRLAEANPSPETELEFGNTYQLLVAVVPGSSKFE